MGAIDRREFLRGTVLAAGGLVALSACGGGPDDDFTANPPTSMTDVIQRREAKQALDVFQGGEDYLAEVENYFAFGVRRRDTGDFPEVRTTVWAFEGVDGTGARVGPLRSQWFAYANPEAPPPAPQGVNAVTLEFPTPGVWRVLVDIETDDGVLYGHAALQVKPPAQSSTLRVGQKAIASQTPTVANPRGVDPICTRKPPCPFHEISLADALARRKPVLFAIGTPQFCQSRTCGPNIDELVTVSRETGDDVLYVHAEVYVDDEPETIQRQRVTQTFREWGLQSEPWLFLIGADGTIRDRFEGPLTAPQIRAALQRHTG